LRDAARYRTLRCEVEDGWGTPTTAMWVYRMGPERAKRYLLSGGEPSAPVAAEIGPIRECVPDEERERDGSLSGLSQPAARETQG
jgi:enoyl-CoA hydratase/carnithine racemase